MTFPNKLPLGTSVFFDHVLQRVKRNTFKNEPPTPHTIYKIWESVPLHKINSGILIGYRTKSSGYTDIECGYEGEWYESLAVWVPKGHVKCAMVVENLYKNPVYVPLDAIWSQV